VHRVVVHCVPCCSTLCTMLYYVAYHAVVCCVRCLVVAIQDMEAAHRAKMMQGTRALQRASDSVHRSRQIAEETDEIGTNIVGEYSADYKCIYFNSAVLSVIQKMLRWNNLNNHIGVWNKNTVCYCIICIIV